MARETLISVTMSVHNGEAYLKEAIESVLSQTYKDFEFIVIDDASTDNSLNILKSYPEIKIIKNHTNLGLTKSLNIALKEAKGEYIARMDADDICMPERLQVQKDFLDNHKDIVVVGSSLNIIDDTGTDIGKKTAITDSRLLHFHMVFKNQMSHPAVMFRKKQILELGGYNEEYRFAQDYDLWSRLIEKKYILSNINKPLLKYRLHNSSITQGKTKDGSFHIAMSIVKRNMSKYISFTDREFDIFSIAHNRHIITKLSDVFVTIKLWNRFLHSYPTDKVMRRFITKEQKNLFRCYIKGLIWKHR